MPVVLTSGSRLTGCCTDRPLITPPLATRPRSSRITMFALSSSQSHPGWPCFCSDRLKEPN